MPTAAPTAKRVGIIGTGFISRGVAQMIARSPDLQVSKVLTRRAKKEVVFPFPRLLSNSLAEVLRDSDILFECSGDVVYGTDLIYEALRFGLPVVTMNSELQVTTGSFLGDAGYLTEAEGDQPGSLAALGENAIAMGFKPLVFGNIKGFLNHTPSLEDMTYWSRKNGISLKQVTSFTDGTKIQIEQALVANGLGARIACEGLEGYRCDTLAEGVDHLARIAAAKRYPISDYLLSSGLPPGVFIVAEHDDEQREALRYLKLGNGPYYTILQPFHLCHLEVAKTLRRALRGEAPLLTNSTRPRVSVAAMAKRDLKAGELIPCGIGSFDVRGVAVGIADRPDHVPIGLMSNAVVTKEIRQGEFVSFEDVELPRSLALSAYLSSRTRVLNAAERAKLGHRRYRLPARPSAPLAPAAGYGPSSIFNPVSDQRDQLSVGSLEPQNF